MIWKVIIGLVLSGIALYFTLRGTDSSLIIETCTEVNWIFWVGVGLLFLIQQFLRAFRQQRIIQTQVSDYTWFESHTLLLCFFLAHQHISYPTG